MSGSCAFFATGEGQHGQAELCEGRIRVLSAMTDSFRIFFGILVTRTSTGVALHMIKQM